LSEISPDPAQRVTLEEQLHRTYGAGSFDNTRVWAGNVSIAIDGLRFDATLSRAYLRPGDGNPVARVRCELFVAAIDPASIRAGHVSARLWTDVADPGRHVPMRLCTGPGGEPDLCAANLVFESEPFPLQRTGAFSYTVEVSADSAGVPAWIAIDDIAPNRDGVIVVSPGWIADSPTFTEVCLRKVDATRRGGRFESGRIRYLTDRLEQLPTDVVYLLPFFRPGFTDADTGQDVRKGSLGSVYAVADFYQIDPELVTPPEQVDLGELAATGLLWEEDVAHVWAHVEAPEQASTAPPAVSDLVEAGGRLAASRWGRERLVQLVGLAQLRQLCQRAHELGKRVIFDLVLMQTSRDSALIAQHPEWYALDEEGRPKIHQIAWLVYSDVALFELSGNRPLQDYLLEVAPYWMARCQLDGVRLDASQTVDRPFLMRLKNRIQRQDPEALVLGETLCALQEAVDVPVDMVYALLVDFHRDAEQATPLIDFLEEVHGTFAAGTVAMAYFENHDSPRATQVWRQRYANALGDDRVLARAWRRRLVNAEGNPELWMALLKNLQATLIDATAGMWPAHEQQQMTPEGRPLRSGGTQLAWAIEWGSEWGETAPTDFENEVLLHPEARDAGPGQRLAAAYDRLAVSCADWVEARRGRVYYHRNSGPGGDAEDRVLAYTRYTATSALLVVNNLDIRRTRWVTIPLDWLPWTPGDTSLVFDSYQALGLATEATAPDASKPGPRIGVAPLQTRLFRLTPGATTRKE
jgi:hypothetical protein